MSVAPQLNHLEAAQLVRRMSAAFEAELEYVFRHAIVQEAVYDSILKTTRAELHRRVAEVIEKLEAAESEEIAAVLAMHYERAGMDEKVFDFAAQAGDAARKIYAHDEALMHYDRVLEATHRLPHDNPRLNERIRRVFTSRGSVFEAMSDSPGAMANFEAMLEFAQRTGDAALQADALNRLNTTRVVGQGASPDMLPDLDRSLALARSSNDPILIGRALWNFGLFHRFHDPVRATGFFEQALDVVESAMRDGVDRTGLRELRADVLNDLKIIMVFTGQMRDSLDLGMRAADEYRAMDNKPMLADALGGMAMANYYMGHPDAARTIGAEGMTIGQTIGNTWNEIYNGHTLFETEIDSGEFDAVIAQQHDRLRAAQSLMFPAFIGMVLMQVARAYMEVGCLDAAVELADRSAKAFESVSSPNWNVWAKGIRARPLIRRGDLDQARAELNDLWRPGDDYTGRMQGLQGAGATLAEFHIAEGRLEDGLQFCDWLLDKLETEGVHRLAGEMRYWRGRIHAALGDLSQAETDLLQAREWLEQAEARILLWRIDMALAKLYAQAGDAERASAAHESAVTLLNDMADNIASDDLRDSFVGQPEVKEALEWRFEIN
jgi:tetratricopeptide (TPR) repeat protein